MSSYYLIHITLDQAYLADLQKRGMITVTFSSLKQSRREAVVNSILEEAALKGPTQINIKEVARRSGVPVGSLYQYFNHRQGLVEFATEIITRQMITLLEYVRPFLKEMSLRDGLKAYLQGGKEIETEFQGYLKFFSRAAYLNDPEVTEKIVKPVSLVMLGVTREILEAARTRGEVRPDIDFEAATRLINTLIIATYDASYLPTLNIYYQLSDSEVSTERILESLVFIIENALGVTRS